LPRGAQTKVVRKGSEPKSLVTLTFHGREAWSRDNENDLRTLAEVLRHRLRQVLREDLGGVYGVRVDGGLSRRPRPEYRLNVSFGCAPENVETLRKAVFDEIEAVQRDGAPADLIAKIKEARRRSHEIEVRQNGFWVSELERAYTFGDDPRLIPDVASMVDKISADRVKRAAGKYAKSTQYVLGILEPEGASPGP
jgi:zinc protease